MHAGQVVLIFGLSDHGLEDAPEPGTWIGSLDVMKDRKNALRRCPPSKRKVPGLPPSASRSFLAVGEDSAATLLASLSSASKSLLMVLRLNESSWFLSAVCAGVIDQRTCARAGAPLARQWDGNHVAAWKLSSLHIARDASTAGS
eukprot:CAMPEP_0170199756 /NCGR_PEP_ID=MMETSP0040_2-20121228/69511_1 /TAXON_ID=641309 /ORGANISM="Lotharella oceanica, Strain CCMP622" /LENGTH=144 /DNA_ID=CAMNT_0010449901 /DNA_START=1979 /DNA_END=2413 /DNA_ORIENTATION=-